MSSYTSSAQSKMAKNLKRIFRTANLLGQTFYRMKIFDRIDFTDNYTQHSNEYEMNSQSNIHYDSAWQYQEPEEKKAFSTLMVRKRTPTNETSIAASIITSKVCNEMYGFIKNTIAIEPLCQTFSCANAPSCFKTYNKKLEVATCTGFIFIWTKSQHY